MIRTWKWIWNHPLAKHRRMAAYGRWLRWQLGTRLVGNPVAIPFVEASRLLVERSMTGATGNIYCGLHEFEDMAFVLHCLRAQDTFVDVGANVGSYTVLASAVVGCRTISLEPVPSTYRKLLGNVRINGIEALVELHHCAAGAESGQVWFRTDLDTMNRVVDEHAAGQKEQVQVRRLDDVFNGRVAAIWKIDVEGYEEEVLRGAERVLHAPGVKAVMLEGHDDRIAEKMRAAGFSAMAYDPWTRQLLDGDRMEGRRASGNHLWVRDRDWVESRCRECRRYEVIGVDF
jgi:FkbM family methyltransferase